MKFHKLKNKSDIVLFESGAFEYSMEQLKAGVYELDIVGLGMPVFRPIGEMESLVEFDSGIVHDIMGEIESFFQPETKEAYEEMGMTYKTGFIMYGKHGTGKTSTAMLAMRKIVKQFGALCFDTDKVALDTTINIIQQLRKIQQNPIILFYDECDSDITSNLDAFTKFMDGNDSIPGVVFLGCTNHINKIPDKVKNRKSRIKRCFEIKSLPNAVYKQYLVQKLPKLDKKIVEEFCYKAVEKALTIDEFKNAIIDFRIFRNTIDKAIEIATETYSSKDEGSGSGGGGIWSTHIIPMFTGGGRRKK